MKDSGIPCSATLLCLNFKWTLANPFQPSHSSKYLKGSPIKTNKERRQDQLMPERTRTNGAMKEGEQSFQSTHCSVRCVPYSSVTPDHRDQRHISSQADPRNACPLPSPPAHIQRNSVRCKRCATQNWFQQIFPRGAHCEIWERQTKWESVWYFFWEGSR